MVSVVRFRTIRPSAASRENVLSMEADPALIAVSRKVSIPWP